jgi:hypothetical protein
MTGKRAPTTVLVPMLNLSVAEDILQVAAILAAGESTPPAHGTGQGRHPGQHAGQYHPHSDTERIAGIPRVVVLSVVEVPPDQLLTSGLGMARSYRALLDFLPSHIHIGGCSVRVDRIVKVARDVPSAVRQAVADEQAGIVLFYWKGYSKDARRYAYGRTLDAMLKDPPCIVVLARPEGWRNSRRVLLPVRGGPSAEQALNIALLLAEHANLPLTVMHNVPTAHKPVGADDMGANGHRSTHERSDTQVEALGEQPYIMFMEHLKAAIRSVQVRVDTVLTRGQDPVPQLLKEIHADDLVIMGLAPPGRPTGEQRARHTQSTVSPPPTHAGTPVPLAVAREKGPPVMLVRTPEVVDLEEYARQMRTRRSRRSSRDLPFEQWFVENTFHGDEFKDPGEFVRAKKAAGLTISVALLTSNDEERMHSIITGLKRVLVEMHPIADQIAVIDAGSTDRTMHIARSLGVEAYSADELLPEHGSLHGRGESWWKSLSVLRGDILVWLDPRARRFHPGAALALAGPLVRLPTLQLVKAFGRSSDDDRQKHAHGAQDASAPGGHPPAEQKQDLLHVDWGLGAWPHREAGALAGRLRVRALKPTDLKALTPAQLASLPPQTIVQVLCPPLAGVIAPFGRDMAGRRQAMLSVPAFAGENLELGLLLSVAAQYGARAIAQVELTHTRPSPPPQPGLHSATEVLQVLARCLQDPTMRHYAQGLALKLQAEVEGRGAYPAGDTEILEVRALGPVQRPPMNSLERGDKGRRT